VATRRVRHDCPRATRWVVGRRSPTFHLHPRTHSTTSKPTPVHQTIVITLDSMDHSKYAYPKRFSYAIQRFWKFRATLSYMYGSSYTWIRDGHCACGTVRASNKFVDGGPQQGKSWRSCCLHICWMILRSHPHTPGRYPGRFTNSLWRNLFLYSLWGFGEVWVSSQGMWAKSLSDVCTFNPRNLQQTHWTDP